MEKSEVKLYDFMTVEEKEEYLRNNTDIYEKYENIRYVTDDYYDNLYVLLENGNLYINFELIDHDISFLHMQNTAEIYAVSNDNRVLPLNNFSTRVGQYMSNANMPYKKVISTVLCIICLTLDGNIKFIHTGPDICVDFNNLTNVDDIDYIEEDDKIIVSHDGEHYEELFIE